MEDLDFAEIGLNIGKQRRRLALNQTDVAQALCISPQYVSQVERAERHPSLALMVALANFLNVDINILLGSNVVTKHRVEKDWAALQAVAAELSYDRLKIWLAIGQTLITMPESTLPE